MDAAIDASGILWSTLSGAMVVMAGGLYALFFALGRLNRNRLFTLLSLLFYALLAVFTALLARSLALEGFWLLVVAVMLIGYFFAPRAIWWLCVGTHEVAESSGESEITPRTAQ